MTTHTRADVKTTAAAMRAELRRTWPGTRFSVRMARGTGYGWLSVSWTDGPTDREVRAITARYQSQRFDSTDDAYRATDVTDWTCDGVISQRTIGPELHERARSLLQHDTDGQPFLISPETGRCHAEMETGDDADYRVMNRYLHE